MPSVALTCDDVEARHLEAGYLAGRLSPEDATAYEAHYFACERCWASLNRATELRAAFATAAPQSRRWFRPGLAAAAVLVVALGSWLVVSQVRAPGPDGTTRGSADTLVVRPSGDARTIGASWRPLPGADSYRLRLFAADGTLLFEREITDTALAVSADSVVPRGATRMFWQLQAFDAARQPLARSPLTPVVTSPVP